MRLGVTTEIVSDLELPMRTGTFGMDRDQLIARLNAADIESRPVWKPMHLQQFYQKCEKHGGLVAEDLFHRGICLPSSSNLTLEDQERVIGVVREAAHNRVEKHVFAGFAHS